MSARFLSYIRTSCYYWPLAKTVLWHCNSHPPTLPTPLANNRLLQPQVVIWRCNKIIHLYRNKKQRESGTIRTANPVTHGLDCQFLVRSPTSWVFPMTDWCVHSIYGSSEEKKNVRPARPGLLVIQSPTFSLKTLHFAMALSNYMNQDSCNSCKTKHHGNYIMVRGYKQCHPYFVFYMCIAFYCVQSAFCFPWRGCEEGEGRCRNRKRITKSTKT